MKTFSFLFLFASVSKIASAQDVNLQWEYLDLGNDIGRRGVEVGDFDGNGYPEMLVTANSYRDVMAIQFDGTEYKVAYKLPNSTNDGDFQSIASLGLLQSGGGDYALVQPDGVDVVYVYDLSTLEFLQSVPLISPSSNIVYLGQVTLDVPAAAYAVDDQLMALYGDREFSFFSKPYFGLSEGIAVFGSFTEAGVIQIVYNDGNIYQYYQASDTFSSVPGFPYPLTSNSGALMVSLDTDGDGVDEIVAEAGIGLECSSALDFGIIWTHDVDYGLSDLIIGDMDSDGNLDVIYGDDDFGEVHGLNPLNGEEFLQVDNPDPDYNVVGLSVGDYDNDGVNELSWCTGSGLSSEDIWVIVDPTTDTEEWRSLDLDGDGSQYSATTTTSTSDNDLNVLVTNVFAGRGEDIVAFDSAIYIIRSDDLQNVYATSPDIGDDFFDVAVANLDGGVDRDVYAVDAIGELWRFNQETGHLVEEVVQETPTAIAALQDDLLGDNVYYGTGSGTIRQLGSSAPGISVCPTGPVLQLRSLSAFSLTFVCEDSFGVFNAPDGSVAFTHQVERVDPQGELIGASISGQNYYLFGNRNGVGLYA